MAPVPTAAISLWSARPKLRRVPRWAKFWQVFPEEFAAVDHSSSSHVEEVHRQHAVFVVIAEDVGVIPFGCGNALSLLQLLDG